MAIGIKRVSKERNSIETVGYCTMCHYNTSFRARFPGMFPGPHGLLHRWVSRSYLTRFVMGSRIEAGKKCPVAGEIVYMGLQFTTTWPTDLQLFLISKAPSSTLILIFDPTVRMWLTVQSEKDFHITQSEGGPWDVGIK